MFCKVHSVMHAAHTRTAMLRAGQQYRCLGLTQPRIRPSGKLCAAQCVSALGPFVRRSPLVLLPQRRCMERSLRSGVRCSAAAAIHQVCCASVFRALSWGRHWTGVRRVASAEGAQPVTCCPQTPFQEPPELQGLPRALQSLPPQAALTGAVLVVALSGAAGSLLGSQLPGAAASPARSLQQRLDCLFCRRTRRLLYRMH